MKAQSFKILKDKLVKSYRKYGDKPCLTVMNAEGGKQYTGNEVANEIESETPFGVGCINTLIGLTIDLLSRNKLTWDERNTKCSTWAMNS